MKQAAVPLTLLLLSTWNSGVFAQPHSTEKLPTEQISKQQSIPAESLYQMLAAELAVNRAQPEVALANYIAAAKQTQDPSVAKRATEIALNTASLEIAVEPAKLWAKLAPSDLEAQITMAAIYVRLFKSKEATTYLKRLQTLNPNEVHQHFFLLYQQMPHESEKEALVQSLEMLAKNSQSPASHLTLGEIYLIKEEPQKALASSQKALKASPMGVHAIQLYCKALTTLGEVPKAKAFLGSLNQRTNRLDIKSYYLQFLANHQFNDEGQQLLKEINRNFDLKPSEILQLAKFTMQAEWYKDATILLDQLREDTKSRDIAHYFLARIAEIENNPTKAVAWFEQVLTGPFHVLSQIRASVLLMELGSYEKALVLLSRTQSQNLTDKKRVLLTQAEVLEKAQKNNEALKRLDYAIELDPDDIEVRYSRSLLATELGQYQTAELDLQTIINAHPNHIDALNALGYLLTNHSNRYSEAKMYLERAMKLSPNNPSVLDSMGWLHYKLGELSTALKYLKRAASMVQDPEIAAHLGEVLWAMKNYEEAKEIWNQALVLNPKNVLILKTMNQLMD